MILATSQGNLELRGANPYAEWGNTAPPPPGSVGGNVGGLAVTTETASQVAAVYGCCGLLADSVSTLPLRVLDKPATVNTATELDIPDWLHKPFEHISYTDWVSQFVWSLALRGNFFGQIVDRDRLGYPTQIMPVSPDIVRPKVGLDGQVQWYFAGQLIPTEDVFHVRYQSMPGTLMGLNPIQIMKYPFGMAHVTDVWATEYFRNAANPQGVVEVPDVLDEVETKKFITGWASAHGGARQSNLPAVLTQGAKFNPISINPADQQLLESRKFSQEEICGVVFRVPPHYLGLNERSTSFGRGIEQQERTFVVQTLAGYLARVERALNECLPPGQFVNLDLRHRIRGDSVQRAETGYKMILAGAWCGDDARELFDMPPAPDGQGKVFHSPTNSELLEMQMAELKKMEEAPPEEEPQAVPANSNGHGQPANVAF